MLITEGAGLGGAGGGLSAGMFRAPSGPASPSAEAPALGGQPLTGPAVSLTSAVDGPAVGANPGDISRGLSLSPAVPGAPPAPIAGSDLATTGSPATGAAGAQGGQCRCQRHDGQLPATPQRDDDCGEPAAAPTTATPAAPAAPASPAAPTTPVNAAVAAAASRPGWTLGTATVGTVQAGPILFNSTTVEGQTYGGTGIAPVPGLGVTVEHCDIAIAPGHTATDVATGWSVGGAYSMPVGPLSGSISGNAAGFMVCSGGSFGTGGASPTWTYVGGGAQSNDEYLAQQRASDSARGHELAAQARTFMQPVDGY